MPNPAIKKISTSNTKQEMLDAYSKLVEMVEAKKETEIKASEKIEEKVIKAAIEKTDSLTSESINQRISDLKYEFNSSLSKLSEKVEEEFALYQNIKKAVSSKQNELNEIFEIQKNAQSLYALIEAQKTKKEEFLEEMENLKYELETEIEEKRSAWEKEKSQKEIEIKEKEKQDQILRTREKEEYIYKFQKEQNLARDKFDSEKAALEKQLKELKENTEKELLIREKSIADNESELKELRLKTAEFPKELARTVEKAVKEATERIIIEAKHKEALLTSAYDGEKKALEIRIESLERNIKEQNDLLAKYSAQLEKSYTQIQDIATKAVTSTVNKSTTYIPQTSVKE